MHRMLAVMLAALAAAGCAAGDPGAGPPRPAAQVRVGFGGIVDTIEIAAVERLPLRAAELVAPDGTSIPASAINVDDAPRRATGQWAVSHAWKDPVTGNSALAALGGRSARAGAALRSEEQLMAMVSSAEIVLPDPAAYRRDWARYRIRLTFGAPPGEVEIREIAAPPPPPR